MEYNSRVNTLYDDCMLFLDTDTEIGIRRRYCAYIYSAIITYGLVTGLFYWTWMVIRDMNNEASG